MHHFLRKVGPLRFALIYIAIAAALSVLLDWILISLDDSPTGQDVLLHFFDQAILLSITTIALFFVLKAVLLERRQEGAKLRETQVAYDQLFRAHTQPMWLVDPHTRRILDVNDVAVKKYGWSRKEFLTLRADDLQYPPP